MVRGYRKKKISKKLREEVWLKHFGETFSSKCPIQWCTRKISAFSFEAGHNIPESKGGQTTIDNLIPICADCNRSMGDRYTIDEFSRKFASTETVVVNIVSEPAQDRASWFQRLCSCFIPKKKPTEPKPKPMAKFVRKRSNVRSIFR
jgi:HNH endonuclease